MRLHALFLGTLLLPALAACSDDEPTGPVSEPVGPVAPSQPSITYTDSISAVISWEDNSSDEQGFRVQNRAGSTGSWFTVAQVPADVTSWSVTDLVPTGRYDVRVAAFDASGETPSPPLTFNVSGVARIVSTLLPEATIGTPYTATILSFGRSSGETVTWTIAEGALPAGLALGDGGTISGTPTSVGSATFTVRLQVGQVRAPLEREFTLDVVAG